MVYKSEEKIARGRRIDHMHVVCSEKGFAARNYAAYGTLVKGEKRQREREERKRAHFLLLPGHVWPLPARPTIALRMFAAARVARSCPSLYC